MQVTYLGRSCRLAATRGRPARRRPPTPTPHEMRDLSVGYVRSYGMFIGMFCIVYMYAHTYDYVQFLCC